LLLVVVLDLESCRSMRVQIRSHVVPWARASVREALNSVSSSLLGEEGQLNFGRNVREPRQTRLFLAMFFSFLALYSL
jgi:hypothetical protein